MKKNSEYVPCEIDNILKNISDESVLQVIRLSTASNDLMSNHKAIIHFPENESGYFFYNSVSILREVAKLVTEMSGSKIVNLFTERTQSSFSILKEHLLPFDDGSLSKTALKPIRDVNFHYKFPKSNTDSTVRSLLKEIKGIDKLAVGVKPTKEDLLSIRYTYADWFRNEYINSHLSTELVSLISGIAVEIVAFLDSLQVDIMEGSRE